MTGGRKGGGGKAREGRGSSSPPVGLRLKFFLPCPLIFYIKQLVSRAQAGELARSPPLSAVIGRVTLGDSGLLDGKGGNKAWKESQGLEANQGTKGADLGPRGRGPHNGAGGGGGRESLSWGNLSGSLPNRDTGGLCRVPPASTSSGRRAGAASGSPVALSPSLFTITIMN
eukprot:scaffold32795_cov35-Tisochrysis_lutea.AAC.2